MKPRKHPAEFGREFGRGRGLSAGVSVALVSGYLLLVVGVRFARLAALAQFAFMVLFSASFFIDGLTGLSVTAGAVITLALLMATTAKVDWHAKFRHCAPGTR